MTAPVPSDNRPTTRPRLRTNLAVAVCSTLVCLALIEIGLRVIAGRQAPVTLAELEARRDYFKGREINLGHMLTASPNPRLVYELIPSLDVLWAGHEVKTNSDGCRDDEFVRPKPAGTIRIAVLGDSTSFGWKVDEQDAYPDVLEQVFNQFSKGPKFDVMNFALPGYNTAMERESLVAKGLPLEPDLVVLQFEGNDVDLPNFIKKPESHWRLNRCYLWEFLKTRRPRGARQQAQEPKGEFPGLEVVPLVKDEKGLLRCKLDESRIPPELRDMVGVENCQKAIRDIGRLCKEKGVRTVFVLNPNYVENYNQNRRMEQDRVVGPFVQAARDGGMVIADPTLPILEFLHAHNLKSPDLWVEPQTRDAHPAPPRHSLIAMEIARVILENDLLPNGAVDKARLKELSAALLERANSQWEAIERKEIPSLSATAITILPADAEREKLLLGEGWYGRETNAAAEKFRWCSPNAKLLLPPVKRLVMEVGTDWPQEIGPPDQEFILDGQSLPYRVAQRKGRGWFDIAIPQTATQKPDRWLELTIKTKRLEIPGIAKRDQRDLGLQVYRIVIETP